MVSYGASRPSLPVGISPAPFDKLRGGEIAHRRFPFSFNGASKRESGDTSISPLAGLMDAHIFFRVDDSILIGGFLLGVIPLAL